MFSKLFQNRLAVEQKWTKNYLTLNPTRITSEKSATTVTTLPRFSKKSGIWQISFLTTLLASLLLAAQPSYSAYAQTKTDWVATGTTLSIVEPGKYCFDYTRPNTLFVSITDPVNSGNVFKQTGTFSFNWKTGEKTLVNAKPFYFCDEATGTFYQALYDSEARSVRFGNNGTPEQTVARFPFYASKDGLGWLYSTANFGQGSDFYASSDSGLTWVKRTPPTSFKWTASISVAENDSRSINWLACPNTSGSGGCVLYNSADSGQTWEKRASLDILNQTVLKLLPLAGHNVPPDTFVVEGNVTSQRALYYTNNGGRTFQQVAKHFSGGGPSSRGFPEDVSLFHTKEGLLRFSALRDSYKLEISSDGGINWQARPLPLPTADNVTTVRYEMNYIPNTQAGFVVSAKGNPAKEMYYTANVGQNWTALGSSHPELFATTYAPTTLIGVESGKVSTLDLAALNKQLAEPSDGTKVKDSLSFYQTFHTIPPVFRRYWDAKGGLARFGLPRTEAFYEQSATDGKVYLTQYFERTRFEYHPEFRGTTFEVLTGLLGSELTAKRQAAGEAPFKPVADPQQAGHVFFIPTQHVVKGIFHEYWLNNGGVTSFGYPISEEFEEVNPDDGKTYTVQYFERVRFERHPEFKGTKYEVLLGLFGNVLLRDKLWIS